MMSLQGWAFRYMYKFALRSAAGTARATVHLAREKNDQSYHATVYELTLYCLESMC